MTPEACIKNKCHWVVRHKSVKYYVQAACHVRTDLEGIVDRKQGMTPWRHLLRLAWALRLAWLSIVKASSSRGDPNPRLVGYLHLFTGCAEWFATSTSQGARKLSSTSST